MIIENKLVPPPIGIPPIKEGDVIEYPGYKDPPHIRYHLVTRVAKPFENPRVCEVFKLDTNEPTYLAKVDFGMPGVRVVPAKIVIG